MKTQRNYPGKDVDMLTICATIVENAIANKEFLVSKRRSWTDPYFPNLKIRIEGAFSNFLGIDSSSEQRNATQIVFKIQVVALDDLGVAKIQMQEDFKSDKTRRNEILKTLGYADFYKQAQAKDQEALVQLLYRFKSNLTENLRNEITVQGTDNEILDRICSYADQMANANITQETLKGTSKLITEESVIEFNSIYDEVISVAKIARSFYKGNPNKQDEFSFNKIRKKLNAPARSTSEEETEE